MPDDLVYAAVIHIKINPEFNLYLDSEGCIVYVEYLNEDAADLFETVDLTGQKLADGMETIVGAAEEKGYLTGQNEVMTDVVWVQEAADGGKLEKVLQTISDSTGKKTCSACGGTGICAECGGGTLPCKRCHGSLVETCSNCDTSGIRGAKEVAWMQRMVQHADIVAEQEKLSANSVAVRMESRALFVMARV